MSDLGPRPRSFFGALFRAFVFLAILAGMAEAGIGWMIAVENGIYEPGIIDILESIAMIVDEIFPGLSFDDRETLVLSSPAIISAILSIAFLPTINANRRHHPHKTAIFMVNLIFGLTGVMWRAAKPRCARADRQLPSG